jgi:ribosomal protein S18 acetylase RimI-like enzyme
VNTEIRRASAADATTLIVLNREVQTKHVDALPWLFKDQDLSAETAQTLLRGENNRIFLENEPAGYIYTEYRCLPETASRHEQHAVHIHHISVQSKFKRLGVGRALMLSGI